MNICDTCGDPITSDHPFSICAKCLFQTALHASPSDSGSSRARAQLGSAVINIPTRRDFFEKYELLERLKEGGQGEVYRAWDFDLRRCVAMKRLAVPFLKSEAAVHRFLAEAQIASQLEHPGILPIHDVGLDPDGRPFFTTSILPGTTLADVFERVRDPIQTEWTLDRALELLARVCEIVGYAHSRGVIHRDLKPSNILVGQFGEIRVIDWGSAHVLREARAAFEEAFVRIGEPAVETDRDRAIRHALDSPLSTFHAGQPITLLFSPPEILRGELALLGPGTDVYSVGVMLYEVVAGRNPYSRPDGSFPCVAELRELILRGPPGRLRAVNPRASRDLEAICEQAMARDWKARYRGMTGVSDDLRAYLEIRPVKARPAGTLIRVQKWARRNSSYVAMGSLALTLAASSASIALRFKGQKDQARQLTALREASLSARSGDWRRVLDRLAEADAAGYRDKIDLALQRVEAWESLGQSSRAQAQLDQLMHLRDLGPYQSAVLLKTGEFQLFDQATAQQGIAHVRSALTGRLDPADLAYAKGLLAETTPEALAQFRQALQLNPYHRGAHRLSLGFEFVLGHQSELDSHLRVFKVLFPDDPSPVAIEATQLALAGNFDQAERLMTARHDTAGMQGAKLALQGFKLLAEAAVYFDLDVMLGDRKAPEPKVDELIGGALAAFMGGISPAKATTTESDIRFPQLPCVKAGIEKGLQALQSMLFPIAGIINPVDAIKEAWKLYPEALLPLTAAMLIPPPAVAQTNERQDYLKTQADLCQIAAGSPSVLPKVRRIARFLAVQSQFELSQRTAGPNSPAREDCLENVRRACDAPETSSSECQVFFRIALRLRDFDLSRQVLARWGRLAPGAREVLLSHVELDIATGAFGSALSSLDKVLAADPADSWALTRREAAVQALHKLVRTLERPPVGQPQP